MDDPTPTLNYRRPSVRPRRLKLWLALAVAAGLAAFATMCLLAMEFSRTLPNQK